MDETDKDLLQGTHFLTSKLFYSVRASDQMLFDKKEFAFTLRIRWNPVVDLEVRQTFSIRANLATLFNVTTDSDIFSMVYASFHSASKILKLFWIHL